MHFGIGSGAHRRERMRTPSAAPDTASDMTGPLYARHMPEGMELCSFFEQNGVPHHPCLEL